MKDRNKVPIDVEGILNDMFDSRSFFSDRSDELFEEDLDAVSAAGNYAGFLSRLGLRPDGKPEER